MKKKTRKPLDNDEIQEILADVARTGPTSARIQAIRMLQGMRDAQPDADSEDEFAELDELEPKRRQRKRGPST